MPATNHSAIVAPNDWPRITVVTPSYNQGQYIGQTIDSVLGQCYPNLEYIIIDGGSTDQTLDVVSAYREHIAHFLSEPDRGQSHALNKGFDLASGDILCWLNSDDQFAPSALFAVALAFRVHLPDLVAGICEVFQDGELIHRHLTSCRDGPLLLNDLLDLDKGWNAGQFFYQPEVFFSRDLWQRAGACVREDAHFSMDYELWCRFALHQARLKVIGTPLAHFRSHADQKTANIRGFKKELAVVRDRFCEEHGLQVPQSRRPQVDWSKKLRIALVNDLGFQYGAGIAHWRLGAALDLAGHRVESFPLVRASAGNGSYPRLLKQLAQFKPDLVLLGNLHAVEKKSIQLLEQLDTRWPCFWLTHDFWLFTGRCAYMGNCRKFLQTCDESCPTPAEYPSLPAAEISPAFSAKRSFLRQARRLTILANSDWAAERAQLALSSGAEQCIPVNRVRLGFPVEVYDTIDRAKVRAALDIPEGAVCLAFSSSSLSDARKGGALLIKALKQLDSSALFVLLIGRVDQELDLGQARTIYTGFLNDQHQVAQALAAADLYVAPSLEETFGQVFIEAALVGTPSVGFAVSGVAEAIIEGVTGFLVQEVSAQALAKRLDQLLADPALRQSVARTAPIYARSQFSLEACYHSLFQAFNQQGLIDRAGIPHKISFSECSRLISQPALAERKQTLAERLAVIPRRGAQWVVASVPQAFKDHLRQNLPGWLDRWLVRFIFGPGG